MSPKARVRIFSAAILVLVVSIYFSSKKLKRDDLPSQATVGVGNVVGNSNDKPEVVENPRVEPPVVDQKSTYVPPGPHCKSIPEFSQTKSELGRIVNQQELREHDFPEFLKQINDFRLKKGLPLPLVVDGSKMGKEGVVYNNCHPSCRGSVNQVFVTRLIGGRTIEVLTQTGDLKSYPVHDSGIEAITVDELSAKGIPFRSWRVPVIDSGWFIAGAYLYYPLDIEGVWLQADVRGNWNFVGKPNDLKKLEEIEPAVKLTGCSPDDHCFTIQGASSSGRHFRAPRACEPILRHSQDEPVNDIPASAPTGKSKVKRGQGEPNESNGEKPAPTIPPPAGGAGGEL